MDNLSVIPKEVLEAFGLPAECPVSVLHGGHINDTYLVNEKYVLQRINTFVFAHPAHIMDNMLGVTRQLRERVLQRGSDPDREILQVVSTAAGQPGFTDSQGQYWRCTLCIPGTDS